MIDYLVSLGWNHDVATGVSLLLGVVAVSSFGLIWLLLGIWVERKFAARIQDRLGPNRVGPYGLFQTFADLGKMLIKEDITPNGADKLVYNIAPLIAVASVVMIWAVVPFSKDWIGADVNVGVLYLAAIGSFGTLAIMLAGWGSNNKYALLGAFRVIAALISYEVPMILAILGPVLLAGTMSVQGIVEGQHIWYIFVIPISAFMFFVSSLAESGRSPFDLIEAESEIVAGYNIEYTGMKFGMFMAAEFMHAFTISALTAVLFLGGWRGIGSNIEGVVGSLFGFLWFFVKTLGVYFLVMLIRNTVPRVRIDQMMSLNWKFLVPVSLLNLLMIAFWAKLFQVDYAATATAAQTASGLSTLAYQFFGTAVLAELPRTISMLISSAVLWWFVSVVTRRFVDLEARTVNIVELATMSAPAPVQSDQKAAPATGQ